MTQRHKWADVIIAWANGEECQYRMRLPKGWSEWATVASAKIAPYVAWQDEERYEYRIYQEPKPDVAITRYVYKQHIVDIRQNTTDDPNVKYTFDGETGKLKAVELIKK